MNLYYIVEKIRYKVIGDKIYYFPTFQNPTGVTWTLERRKSIADITGRYNKVVIEDNPYGELRFKNKIKNN